MAQLDTATSATQSRSRWMGVGQSSDRDPFRAGRSAAEQAIQGEEPKLLVVFCSDSYDLESLLDGLNEGSGGIPLIGCSTAGEIATAGPGDASVVAMAIGGQGFSVATAAASAKPSGLREASAHVAGSVDLVEDRPHKVLLLLTDGLAGDQQEVVRGAYGKVGAGVPLVGGCAGDDLKMRATFQLHGRQVLTDSVVGAAIASDGPIGIGVRHGWRKVGPAMLVTKSAGNRVYTIDDQPALDVYLDRLNAPPEVREDAAAFTRFAITHPLGISRRSGEEVRFIGEANFEDRSLGCIAEVTQGGLTWFMEGDSESVLTATAEACDDAVETMGGTDPLGFVAFDCIARRGVLGDKGIRTEINQISEHASGGPVVGFYTYGEIARTKGTSGFHNQTLVVLALG